MRQQLHIWLKRLCASLFIVGLLLFLAFLTFKVRLFTIYGHSMFPTITSGDKCIVYLTDNVERGDVVIIDMGDKYYCKRVIGIGNDEVFVCKYGVSLNRRGQYEYYVLLFNFKEKESLTKLGREELWVMGDNRSDSLDSRNFGPIHKNRIIGKVVWVLGRIP